jgi:hypothetical protein
MAIDVKALQPMCMKGGPLSNITDPEPHSLADLRPLPRSPPGYSSSSCTANPPGQGHTAWVDGNTQETGFNTAWPPNKVTPNTNQVDIDLLSKLVT